MSSGAHSNLSSATYGADDALSASDDWEEALIAGSAGRVERRLQMLQELAEVGMDLARALRRRVIACEALPAGAPSGEEGPDEAAAGPVFDAAQAFAKLSRSIRLTINLDVKVERAWRSERTDVAGRAEARRGEAKRQAAERRAAEGEARAKKLERMLESVMDSESFDEDERDDITFAIEMSLAYDEGYEGWQDRPLAETLDRICADFAIDPDWRSRVGGVAWLQEQRLRWPSRRPATALEPRGGSNAAEAAIGEGPEPRGGGRDPSPATGPP